MARGTSKARKTLTEAERAARAAREAAVQGWTLRLGYAIVALSVVAGFIMSFRPQVFGMSTSNPAIGFGVAALAGFRLYALRKELRRQTAEADVPSKSEGRSRRSARRSS